jgi:hypothetical protein
MRILMHTQSKRPVRYNVCSAVLRIRHLFWIRIHKSFFLRIRIRMQIRIRILQTYSLTQTIPKFPFNSKQTFHAEVRGQKICKSEKVCFFSFKSLKCHIVRYSKYSVWILVHHIRIRKRIFIWILIRQKVSNSFGFE